MVQKSLLTMQARRTGAEVALMAMGRRQVLPAQGTKHTVDLVEMVKGDTESARLPRLSNHPSGSILNGVDLSGVAEKWPQAPWFAHLHAWGALQAAPWFLNFTGLSFLGLEDQAHDTSLGSLLRGFLIIVHVSITSSILTCGEGHSINGEKNGSITLCLALFTLCSNCLFSYLSLQVLWTPWGRETFFIHLYVPSPNNSWHRKGT